MITRSSDPLPPNSAQPYPAWLTHFSRHKRTAIEMMASKARAAVECAPNPYAYADLGPQIMADVARAPLQSGMIMGQTNLIEPPTSPQISPISAAPTVVPLDQPADSGILPTGASPRGDPVSNKSGPAWGNSSITPPSCGTGPQPLSPWVFLAGLAVAWGLLNASTSTSSKGIF